jgi:hypothetical protein
MTNGTAELEPRMRYIGQFEETLFGPRIVVGSALVQQDEHSIQNSVLLAETDKLPWTRRFFTGPLFFNEHENELIKFYGSVKKPLDLLEDQGRKKGLVEVISSINLSPNLFSMNGELNGLLDDIYNQGHLYQRFSMQTDKKIRKLSVPQKSFKYFLENYVLKFALSLQVHPCAHGGEKGWSVEKSLRTHLPVKSSVCFDMTDAFGQATIDYVFGFFYDALKRKVQDQDKLRDAAGFLSSITCISKPYKYETIEGEKGVNYENSLPQGSPVSMAIFNRMMFPIDQELDRFSRKKGMKYSRWVDDFVVTSEKQRNFANFEWVLRLAQEHFSLAPDKLYFRHHGDSYLLGHKINYNSIEKLDKKEFESQRGEPYTGSSLQNTHPRGNDIYQDWGEPYQDHDEDAENIEDIPF